MKNKLRKGDIWTWNGLHTPKGLDYEIVEIHKDGNLDLLHLVENEKDYDYEDRVAEGYSIDSFNSRRKDGKPLWIIKQRRLPLYFINTSNQTCELFKLENGKYYGHNNNGHSFTLFSGSFEEYVNDGVYVIVDKEPRKGEILQELTGRETIEI